MRHSALNGHPTVRPTLQTVIQALEPAHSPGGHSIDSTYVIASRPNLYNGTARTTHAPSRTSVEISVIRT